MFATINRSFDEKHLLERLVGALPFILNLRDVKINLTLLQIHVQLI